MLFAASRQPAGSPRRLFGSGVLDGIAGAVKPMLSFDDDPDLARLGIFGDIRIGTRSDDQHARDRVAVVADLMSTLPAARERHDVALRELALAVVHPNRRTAAQHDEHLLAPVMEVVDELRRTRLELPDRSVQRAAGRAHDPASADATPVGHVIPDVAGFVAHSGSTPSG